MCKVRRHSFISRMNCSLLTVSQKLKPNEFHSHENLAVKVFCYHHEINDTACLKTATKFFAVVK